MQPSRVPSPAESVVSGIGKMWGFRDLQELQARDGKLFQREVARRLYGDLRRVVVDCLSSLRETTEGSPEAYREGLDHCRNWHPVVAREEMQNALRMFPDLQARIQAVAVLYAKTLYSEQCKLLGQPTDLKTMRMQRPDAENLLRNFFRRVCMSSWVKTGSFWDMDPIQQDFVLREAFRDALSQDCVKVTVAEIPAPATFSSGSTVLPQQGTDDGLVTADDSISAVMARAPRAESEEDASPALPPANTLQRLKEDTDRVLPPELPLIVEWGPAVAEGPSASSGSVDNAPEVLSMENGVSGARTVAPSAAPSVAPVAKRSSTPAPSVVPSSAPSVAPVAKRSSSPAPSVAPLLDSAPRYAASPKPPSIAPSIDKLRTVVASAEELKASSVAPSQSGRANVHDDDAASVPATYVRDQILGPITVQLEDTSQARPM
jgi:hypothetical protein